MADAVEAGIAVAERLISTRPPSDEPVDPSSLDGELMRLADYLGTVDHVMDLHIERLHHVLRDDLARATDPPSEKRASVPLLTSRVRELADRAGEISDRLQFTTQRIDLP